MSNIYNKKDTLDAINKIVTTQYIKNLKDIKIKNIRLYRSFPHTGAPNLSEAVTLMVFDNLEKLLSTKYNISNN